MTSAVPSCRQCGVPYTTPGCYAINHGLCEQCRPIKLCPNCGGRGSIVRQVAKNARGIEVVDCPACGGDRHEPATRMPSGQWVATRTLGVTR